MCQVTHGAPGKPWGTGTADHVGEASPTWHFPASCSSWEVGSPAHLGTAEARQQGLGAEPMVTTDRLQAPGSHPQCPGQKGRKAESSPRDTPLGLALTFLSWDPALIRSQDKEDIVWKCCHCTKKQAGMSRGPQWTARTAWTAAPPSAVTAVSPAGAPPPLSAW